MRGGRCHFGMFCGEVVVAFGANLPYDVANDLIKVMVIENCLMKSFAVALFLRPLAGPCRSKKISTSISRWMKDQ